MNSTINANSILVVGASSAIGCELIRQLSSRDSLILAHYHSGKDRLHKVASETNSPIIPIQADLSTVSGVNCFVKEIEATCGFPQKIVFLAAHKVTMSRFKDLDWEDFQHHLDMQLCTAVKVLAHFLPKMALAKSGRVIFILSSATLGVPPSAMAHYVTAKYALLGLMRSLASEYAGKQICINAISPSMIETPFLSQIPEKIIELTAQQHPLKRNALPSEIASVISFLLSKEASFITGVNIPVTGGICI